jgi:Tfp pilus assembly protein PilO
MKLESLLKEKILIIAMALLFAFSAIFYFAFVRPLAAEKTEKEAALQRINTDASSYEKVLQSLEPQTVTEAEKQELIEGIPGRSNLEQVIKAIEKTEGETGTTVSTISFQTESEEEAQAEVATSSDGTVEQDQWSKVFPESIYKLLEKKVSEVKEFTVSYIDVQISLNGSEEDINQFVNKLETMPRVFHIQNVTYSQNTEKGNMDASVSARVFYCEAFQAIIEKATITKVAAAQSEESVEEPKSEEKVIRYDTDIVVDSSSIKITTDTPPVEGEGKGFYLVQTGAYTADKYLFIQVDNILSKGIDPRVSDSSISLIFSSISHDMASATEKAKAINSLGFETYIMPLKINLSAEENEWLLPVAQQALSSITSATTKGIAEGTLEMTGELKGQVSSASEAYDKEVTDHMESLDDSRKGQLEKTMTILKDIEEILVSYEREPDVEKLWKIDGLLIDYTLNLNGNMQNNR